MRHELVEQKLEDLRRLSAERGLRLTHQRMEILRELASATDHPSAETVHGRVQRRLPTVSLDTVYRTLCTLEDLGLAAKVSVVGDNGRFDADLSPHHHFVCDACHEVRDFAWPDLDDLPIPGEARALGRVDGLRVILKGTCADCLARRAGRDS
jgi:Fur family peroxide stress response transcriptional regulator